MKMATFSSPVRAQQEVGEENTHADVSHQPYAEVSEEQIQQLIEYEKRFFGYD
jgi:hypothetical protein